MVDYNTIYVNGDSYSQLSEDHKVYSDFFSELYPDTSVINRAIYGSNNARIFRTSTEDLLSATGKIFAVIGFSFTQREEIWYTGDYPASHIYEKNTSDFPVNSELVDKIRFDTSVWHFYEQETNAGYDDPDIKNMITNKHVSPTKNMTDFIFNLVQFSGFLKSQNIDYLLFRAAKEDDMQDLNWYFIKSTSAWKYTQQDPGILDLNFNIPDFAADYSYNRSKTGHMYEDGHRAFAEYLKQYV